MSDSTYELATKLADELAENYLASNIADMMITDARKKAEAIRKMSDENTNQLDDRVQEYRRDRRAIYSAIYNLIEGYGGYKIVKEDE